MIDSNYIFISLFPGNILLFICGTALTWSSSELPLLADPTTTPFNARVSPEMLSWISSLLTLGAAIGPFIFGYLSDKIGRKPTLLYLGVPFLVCYPTLAFSRTTETFLVARFVLGLAVGGALIVLPIYIGEIADKSNRGALGASMSCFICFGILFSCSVGPYVSVMAFNLILAVFPVLFLGSFCVLAPESPHFYAGMDDKDAAKAVLERIRDSADAAEKELEEIDASIIEAGRETGFLDIFKSRGTIRAMVISVGLLVFQQFSGINAVLFYSQQIFHQTGSTLPAEICTIIVVGVQFLSSFLTPFIVDKFGRKIILFSSAVGMAVSEIPLGVYCYLKDRSVDVDFISFLPILSLTAFIVTFNSGFGPLPWALLCELFPPSVKSAATASVASFIWVVAFFVTKYFEEVVQAVGMGQLFLFFAACCFAAAGFVVFCVVETRGKSLREVQEALRS